MKKEKVKNLLWRFDEKNIPCISEVGGKGYSLCFMTSKGLQVPPGFILTTNFFEVWVDQLKSLQIWENFITSDAQETVKYQLLNELKKESANLHFTNEQLNILETGISFQKNKSGYYAVRSSSPEEDLEGASFAGGYETKLGVKVNMMQSAIKEVFASCLDPRIFKYKKEKGFDDKDFRIAVVIMEQLSSEISGVAFSLNPINNDYDEAVVTSNWGLGETIVSGQVNPDQYVINKLTKTVIEKMIGNKEKVLLVNSNEEGGVIESDSSKFEKETLNESQILELTNQINLIEDIYKRPMDIEWAIVKNKLFLLQARPITTQMNLPHKLLTSPLEKRRIYLDITIAIQAANRLYSNLGTSVLKCVISKFGERILGSQDAIDIKLGAAEPIGGKILFNISNLWTLISKENFLAKFKNMNTTATEILSGVVESFYKADNIPDGLSFSKIGMAWRLPVSYLLFPNFLVNRIKSKTIIAIQSLKASYESNLQAYKTKKISFKEMVEASKSNLFETIANYFLPCMLNGVARGYFEIIRLFENLAKNNPDIRNWTNELSRCLPENVTNQMGLTVYKLSTLLDKTKYADFDNLVKEFNNKALSNDFNCLWNEFMELYGFRGEMELDISSPRYRDDQLSILKQVHSNLINTSSENNPLKLFEDAESGRASAYKNLLKIADVNGFKSEFHKAYELCVNLMGFRETPKYFLIKLLGIIRVEVLELGNRLRDQGLLNSSSEVFNINFEDAVKLIDEPQLKINIEQLNELIKEASVSKEIFSKWKSTPLIFDSRGRILNLPKKEVKEGELSGQSVSYGIARGKVKVMNSTDEKPFIAGEILVTKATDPGWTPLIMNSAAVILEIGGMLQHGALVSREFGKPCIVGVEKAMERLKDGDFIEVDAIQGIVRILKEE